MAMKPNDLEREDFFQIHTDMCYLKNYKDFELAGGGLFYPSVEDADIKSAQNSEGIMNAFNWIDGFHGLWHAVSQGNTVGEAVNPDLRELLEHFQKRFWGD
jgi:hypothetical protein